MSDIKNPEKPFESPTSGSPDGAPSTGATDLSDEDIREGVELLFYAYRDFISDPDEMLKEYGFGRAHHRVVHFVARNPGMTVSELLSILRITKQSLGRVLKQLVDQGFILQASGVTDRRQRLLSLTDKGQELENRLSALQRARVGDAWKQAGPEAIAGYKKVLANLINPADREEILKTIKKR
jgi:DNA-binding MarR family transcriptional regulator